MGGFGKPEVFDKEKAVEEEAGCKENECVVVKPSTHNGGDKKCGCKKEGVFPFTEGLSESCDKGFFGGKGVADLIAKIIRSKNGC